METCALCDKDAVDACQRCGMPLCYDHLKLTGGRYGGVYKHCPHCKAIFTKQGNIIALIVVIGVIVATVVAIALGVDPHDLPFL